MFMVIIFDRLIKQLIKHLEHGSWGFFFYLIGLSKFFDYDCFFLLNDMHDDFSKTDVRDFAVLLGLSPI